MIEQMIKIGDFLHSDGQFCRPDHISYDKFLLPLSQFDLLTTTDSAIPLYTCSRINPMTENNRSGTLFTMRRLS